MKPLFTGVSNQRFFPPFNYEPLKARTEADEGSRSPPLQVKSRELRVDGGGGRIPCQP